MNPSCAPIKCPTTFPMTKEIKNTISVTMLGSSLFFIVFLLLHSLVQEFIHEVHLSLASNLGRTRCPNRSVRVSNRVLLDFKQSLLDVFLIRNVVPVSTSSEIMIVSQPLEQSILPDVNSILADQL